VLSIPASFKHEFGHFNVRLRLEKLSRDNILNLILRSETLIMTNALQSEEQEIDIAELDAIATSVVAENFVSDSEKSVTVEEHHEKAAKKKKEESSDVFSALGLSQDLVEMIRKIGFTTPTPVQAECIPHILAGKNVLALAQTGTGKTGAFVLPLLQKLETEVRVPQLLILTPTRELAQQVAKVFEDFSAARRGARIVALYGGQSMRSQIIDLKHGAQIVVGTPGRIMDHVRRGTLALGKITTVVLDEADEMLNMGFVEDIEWILGHTPKEKQVALFSATMPPSIRRIAETYLINPVEVRIKAHTASTTTIQQQYWTVSGASRLEALTRILEVDEFDGVLIFVRTKSATVDLADRLVERGFSAAAINGDLAQNVREQMISKLKSGAISILVATDVAARGLDVDRISLVVNFEMPNNSETYVHRIGRTGRAGRSGRAILFLLPKERRFLRNIQSTMKSVGTMDELVLPTRQQVLEARVKKFKTEIAATLLKKSTSLEMYERVVEEVASEHGVQAITVAAALCARAMESRAGNGESRAGSGEARSTCTYDSGRSDSFGSDRGRRNSSADRGFSDRGERGERRERSSERGSSSRRREDSEEGMVRYKINVGQDDQVTPGNLVGSIAEATGIRGSSIGRIQILPAFSIIDLPSELPGTAYRSFQKIWINNRQMSLEAFKGEVSTEQRSSGRERRSSDSYAPERKRESYSSERRSENFSSNRTSERKREGGSSSQRHTSDTYSPAPERRNDGYASDKKKNKYGGGNVKLDSRFAAASKKKKERSSRERRVS
jgi:ATP-dependent RNA helicase DeaD